MTQKIKIYDWNEKDWKEAEERGWWTMYDFRHDSTEQFAKLLEAAMVGDRLGLTALNALVSNRSNSQWNKYKPLLKKLLKQYCQYCDETT